MSLKDDLQAPFDECDIEWRIAQSGAKNGKPWAKCLAYIDARAVQDRLDDVLGPDSWRDEYTHVTGGVMCKLSLRINNEWITKENGSDETDIEAFKGGISKALVRAASTWGVGRYLYRLTDNWANVHDKGERSGKIDGAFRNWDPPKLPDWALTMGTHAILNSTELSTHLYSKGPDPAVRAQVEADLAVNILNNPLAPGGSFGPTAPVARKNPTLDMKCGEAQGRALYGAAMSAGLNHAGFMSFLAKEGKVNHTKELTLGQHKELLKKLEDMKRQNK